MAMILAAAALLSHMDDQEARTAGRAVREACLEVVSSGIRTADLGGHASTTEFTDEVLNRIRSKLDVWATLGDV
jgi:isocitrate dehydrogenase (NAD+)